MDNLIKIVLPVIGVLIFNAIGVSAHSLMINNYMGHASSRVVKALSCSNLCLSLPAGRINENEIEIENKDINKDEEPSYRSLLEPIDLSVFHFHTAQPSLSINFEPPPPRPSYILHAVFRS